MVIAYSNDSIASHSQELCPFPAPELRRLLARYPRAQRVLLCSYMQYTRTHYCTSGVTLYSHELVFEPDARAYLCAAEFVWAQEEHRNAGAWTFVRPRFQNLLGLQVPSLSPARPARLPNAYLHQYTRCSSCVVLCSAALRRARHVRRARSGYRRRAPRRERPLRERSVRSARLAPHVTCSNLFRSHFSPLK